MGRSTFQRIGMFMLYYYDRFLVVLLNYTFLFNFFFTFSVKIRNFLPKLFLNIPVILRVNVVEYIKKRCVRCWPVAKLINL